jgi:hypothetical protein
MIDACDRMPDVVWSSDMEEGRWTGEDVKNFIWVVIARLFKHGLRRERSISPGTQ